MQRKALGRGLSSLLREVDTTTSGLESVAVELIDPNPFQPRRDFAEDSLKELTDSIRSTGVVQPVLLRRSGERYQLIAGERRWRAARSAGLAEVPALIRDLGDRETLELALTENLLREDLNPMDVASGYEALRQKFGMTHEEIAARLGTSRASVTNSLRLLGLAEAVQKLVASRELSMGHARSLAALESHAAQAKLARVIVDQGLSVREVERRVSLRELPKQGKAPKPDTLDANMRAAVIEMERTLGTRVKIVGNPNRGQIVIRYFSAEDLNRLFAWIVRS
ncbi:MAG: chromosome partitioning protein ParB [Acidobacteria bacterium]|nr:MAG: chromosome partitioning protein ParB [Acidobacteriota bacterium]